MTAVGEPQSPHTRDLLAEIEAEVAQELEEERPPRGGSGYQVVGALTGLAVGAAGAVLAYGYGLGSLREPGPGLLSAVLHDDGPDGPVSPEIAVANASLLLIAGHDTTANALTW